MSGLKYQESISTWTTLELAETVQRSCFGTVESVWRPAASRRRLGWKVMVGSHHLCLPTPQPVADSCACAPGAACWSQGGQGEPCYPESGLCVVTTVLLTGVQATIVSIPNSWSGFQSIYWSSTNGVFFLFFSLFDPLRTRHLRSRTLKMSHTCRGIWETTTHVQGMTGSEKTWEDLKHPPKLVPSTETQ